MRITIRRRTLALLMLIGVAVVIAWGIKRKATPPQVPFVKVTRETIRSMLNTNGKVEPIDWAAARAERQGVIESVFIHRGQNVAEGEQLVKLNDQAATASLASAEAQIAGARAELRVLQEGGLAPQRTEIENELAKAQLDLQQAEKTLGEAQRLYAKQAGTKVDVDNAQAQVNSLKEQIEGLKKRRGNLVDPQQRSAGQAKLQEALAAAELAKHNLALSIIRSPIAGTVYDFDQRIGSFVNPGDTIAKVGRLDRVHVIVYVDEPDLGRLAIGMPVSITWDAMPGRQWKGAVDKLPTQVVSLTNSTRQVGEVSCDVRNPDHDLLPGTNINAEIQSKVVPDALVIPKQALRRDGAQYGVLLLNSDERVVWRPVQLGVSSFTTVQLVKGVSDGDSVALPMDKPIKDGARVEAVYP
ncbi:MAG TPA: efflux RND transporter periplasmic adaptor subunit [Bryobacteraceae bacterium]|nr:efflux RND transporter periplasmic adaptor subunit [Bryobacteraceae bacterium]